MGQLIERTLLAIELEWWLAQSTSMAASTGAKEHGGNTMDHDNEPYDNVGFTAGDRVELVSTSDPYTRLRPRAQGTVTGIGQIPTDPPEVQIHIAWDSGSTLAMLPGAGDQLRKLTGDQDASD